MANGAGSFEKAFEELIRRVLREEVASGALGGAAVARAAAPGESVSSSGPGIGAVNQAVNGILQPTGQTDIMAATLRGALASGSASPVTVMSTAPKNARMISMFAASRMEAASTRPSAVARTRSSRATSKGHQALTMYCITSKPSKNNAMPSNKTEAKPKRSKNFMRGL